MLRSSTWRCGRRPRPWTTVVSGLCNSKGAKGSVEWGILSEVGVLSCESDSSCHEGAVVNKSLVNYVGDCTCFIGVSHAGCECDLFVIQ